MHEELGSIPSTVKKVLNNHIYRSSVLHSSLRKPMLAIPPPHTHQNHYKNIVLHFQNQEKASSDGRNEEGEGGRRKKEGRIS
jgi:hypothetical protein